MNNMVENFEGYSLGELVVLRLKFKKGTKEFASVTKCIERRVAPELQRCMEHEGRRDNKARSKSHR